MNASPADQRPSPVLAIVALGVAGAAPLLILLGAVGAGQGWFDVHVGFDWLAVRIAPVAAILGATLGGLALVTAPASPRRSVTLALAAILLGAGTGVACGVARALMVRSLPVHDTATDWRDPLLFSPTLMLARGLHADPVESAPATPYDPFHPDLAGRSVAEVNARSCPAAKPIGLKASPVEAYRRLLAAVSGMGLALVVSDGLPDAHGRRRLEAVATSRWFGFKDDLAARLQPVDGGTRLDVRVTSRLGVSDFGRGCRLIERLRTRLDA